MATLLYVRDLPNPIPSRTLPEGGTLIARQPCLWCKRCDEKFSANPGDYFWMPRDRPFRCGQCRTPLVLVTEQRVMVPYPRRS